MGEHPHSVKFSSIFPEATACSLSLTVTGRHTHLHVTEALSCLSFYVSFKKHFKIVQFTYISLLTCCASLKETHKLFTGEAHWFKNETVDL